MTLRRLTIFAAGLVTLAASAITPDELLDKTASAVHADGHALTALFSAEGAGSRFTGTLVMQGNLFYLDSDDMKVWFDGNSQWTFSPAVGEVNLTTPTADEIAQVNPFSILSSVRKGYSARIAEEKGGNYKVILTPRDKKSDIHTASLTISSATYLPSEINVTFSDGTTLDIDVKSVKKSTPYPKSTFSFNKSSLPGVEVIDLR